MNEEPRNWDKELANIDKVIAKQPAGPPARVGSVNVVTQPQRRFVALTWFWTALAIMLAVALPLWPNDKSCGIRLVFYMGAAGIALLMGVLGAWSSWSYRRGLAHLLSLMAIAWAGIMSTREILPRTGYARHSLTWTCPEIPAESVDAPAPQAQ